MTFNLESGVVPEDDPRYHRQDGIYVPAGEGVSKWVSGDVYTIKVSGKESGGALGLAEASIPPGGGPPPHAHAAGEAFYILSGEVELLNGNKTIEAAAGDFLWVPPGARHAFKNVGLHPVKLIFLFAPGGMEETFLQGGLDPRPGEQSPPWGPEEHQHLAQVVKSLGLESELLL